jgi:hypothetical protein
MGLIFLLFGILLFGSAFWLWHLSRKHIRSFAIITSLSHVQEVRIYSLPEKSNLTQVLRKAASFLPILVPLLLMLFALVIVAASLFYLYLKGYRYEIALIVCNHSGLRVACGDSPIHV